MNVEEGSPRLPQSEGAAAAVAEPLVTIHEARGLIRLHLGLDDLAAHYWLFERIEAEVVEPLYEEGVTRWGESPLPGSGTPGPSGRPRRPDPKHWHFRKGQLLEAVHAYRKRRENPWRTRVPAPAAGDWISHALARGIVAAAVGSDLEVATAWLVSRSLSSGATLRARFRPRDLAQREQISPREEFRALHQSLMADLAEMGQGHGPVDIAGHAGCCLWFGPREALVAGACPGTGLTAADVEWHEGELRDALARAFPAGVAASAAPDTDPTTPVGAPRNQRPPEGNGEAAPGTDTPGALGRRGYKQHDAPLVLEMRQAIDDGRADNPWTATALVVGCAKGGGSEESKRKRLLTRYLKNFQN